MNDSAPKYASPLSPERRARLLAQMRARAKPDDAEGVAALALTMRERKMHWVEIKALLEEQRGVRSEASTVSTIAQLLRIARGYNQWRVRRDGSKPPHIEDGVVRDYIDI